MRRGSVRTRALPFATSFLLFDSVTAALLIYFPAVILSAMYLGPSLAMIQAMVKQESGL